MLTVNSWPWWCGCSLTAGPAARSPALWPPTVSMCAREGACHVTTACLGVRAQRPADHHHHRLLLLLVPGPWSRWVVLKPHLTSGPNKLGVLWIRQLVCVFQCSAVCLALICVRCLYFTAFLFKSFYLTGQTKPVTLSCLAGWCITEARAYSQDICFTVTTTSAPTPTCLIYSCDLKQGQTAFTYLELIETNLFHFMTSLFLMF